MDAVPPDTPQDLINMILGARFFLSEIGAGGIAFAEHPQVFLLQREFHFDLCKVL